MRPYLLPVLCLLIGGALGLLGGWCWFSPSGPAAAEPLAVDLRVTDGGVYRVRKAVDGDTVMLENGLHVRYHGANAPESGRFVKDPDPLAATATARNIALVEGKRVRLHLAREPLDIHGRLIARIEVLPEDSSGAEASSGAETGLDVSAQLIKEGLAKAMGLGLSSDEYRALKTLEAEARAAKLGIWGLEEKVRAADAAGSAKPYWAKGGSDVYHLSTCSSAQKIGAANRHEYATAEEAEAVGKRPCKHCLAK